MLVQKQYIFFVSLGGQNGRFDQLKRFLKTIVFKNLFIESKIFPKIKLL